MNEMSRDFTSRSAARFLHGGSTVVIGVDNPDFLRYLELYRASNPAAKQADVPDLSDESDAFEKISDFYTYPPLSGEDGIRLLELLPGTDEPLECNILPIKLSDKQDFEALSYTWGNPKFPNPLREAASNSYFRITNNLRDALQALRLPTASRRLWVDAVCINQADDVEKGPQVGMMKKIYQSAGRVVVWLGKEVEYPTTAGFKGGARDGLEILETIGRDCSVYGFDKIYPPFPRHIKDRSAFEQLKELAQESDCLSLLPWYDRQWYERVWCVQEFILAKDLVLQCGSKSISYDHFSKATAVLQLIARRPSLVRQVKQNITFAAVLANKGFLKGWPLIQQRERYWGMGAMEYGEATSSSSRKSVYAYTDPVVRPSSIIEYCAFAKDLGCSKGVDRIYGMLGFAHESLDIKADYDTKPEKVWEELARQTLLLGDLTVLHYAGIPAVGEPTVKSFAADFGNWEDKVTTRLGGHGHPRFHAATEIPANVQLEPDGSVRVHAIKVDTVNQINFLYERVLEGLPAEEVTKEVAHEFEEHTRRVKLSLEAGPLSINQDVLRELLRWWLNCLQMEGPRHYSNKQAELAFRRTIVAGNGLPLTTQLFPSVEILDLMFVIYMLAYELPDEDGQMCKVVDTWEVYKTLGHPMRLHLSTFQDEPETTYYFPRTSRINAFNDLNIDMLQSKAFAAEKEPQFSTKPERMIGITDQLKDELENYAMAISNILSDRHMFFTNVRLLGIGPKGMKQGDVIMVPEGAQTPFVYRPTAEGEGFVRWGKLIGECYIYGLMDGDPAERLKIDWEESHIEVILS